MASDRIVIRGAREHNLKNVDLEIPRDRLVVITGLSGSGKSTLAFDTIYAEGQRRYVESLSAYARQFLEQMEKPDVDSIEGLSPAISIEQKTTSRNPRSTVGTVTEIYDYLRVLYARIGTPHCPQCGQVIAAQTVQQMVDRVRTLPAGTRVVVLAPVVRGRKGEYRKLLFDLRRQGFGRVRVNGTVRDLAEEIELDKNKKHTIEVVVDRLVIRDTGAARLADSLETALRLAEGVVVVEVPDGGQAWVFSERLACVRCGISFPEVSPRMFSFNNPFGACPACGGLGTRLELDPDLVVPDPRKSLAKGALAPWAGRESVYFRQTLAVLARKRRFSLETPWKELSKATRELILRGTGEDGGFDGVLGGLERRYKETTSEDTRVEIERYMAERPCPTCGGGRLRPESLAVRVGGRPIHQVCALTIKEAGVFFDGLALGEREQAIARRVLKEIRERLGFLQNVGLEYLTLDRAAGTLSGGEGQRIRLATQIGSSLVGVLYILDEPSIGLHQRDNRRLLDTLLRLRDLGNTVLVVEHDEETIRAADHVIDLGPGRRGAGRLRRRHRHSRGDHGGPEVADGALPVPRALDPGPGRAPRRHRQGPDDPRGPRAQPQEHAGPHPAGDVHLRHGRVRLREVHARQRHPLPGPGSGLPPGAGAARRARPHRGACSTSTRSSTSTSRRSAAPRAPTRPRTRASSRSSGRCSRGPPTRGRAATRRGASRSTSRAAGARRARATGW